jgi:hypothetical protein
MHFGQNPGLGSLNTASLPGLQAENHTIRSGSVTIQPQDIVLQTVPEKPASNFVCSLPFASALAAKFDADSCLKQLNHSGWANGR